MVFTAAQKASFAKRMAAGRAKKKTYRKKSSVNVYNNSRFDRVNKQLLPKSYSIVADWEYNGSIPVAGIATTGTAYQLALCNSLTNATTKGPLNVFIPPPNIQNALNTSTPLGINQFFSFTSGGTALYSKMTITAASCSFTLQPVGTLDNANVALVPEQSMNLTAGSRYGSLYAVSDAPFSVTKMCTVNNDVKGNTLYKYINCADFAGISRKSYIDDAANSTFNTKEASSYLNQFFNSTAWVVFIQLGNSLANASAISYHCKFKYWITFNTPAQQQLT